MKISLEGTGDRYYIRAYRPGAIAINEQTYTRSLIVSGDTLQPDWAPRHIDELLAEHLKPILALEPEVVLLGTGERLAFPAAGVSALLGRRGIGLEVMDTGAACRTYNVLIAEGRAVVAALIIERGAGEPG